jgi:hypothetical protein
MNGKANEPSFYCCFFQTLFLKTIKHMNNYGLEIEKLQTVLHYAKDEKINYVFY